MLILNDRSGVVVCRVGGIGGWCCIECRASGCGIRIFVLVVMVMVMVMVMMTVPLVVIDPGAEGSCRGIHCIRRAACTTSDCSCGTGESSIFMQLFVVMMVRARNCNDCSEHTTHSEGGEQHCECVKYECYK